MHCIAPYCTALHHTALHSTIWGGAKQSAEPLILRHLQNSTDMHGQTFGGQFLAHNVFETNINIFEIF